MRLSSLILVAALLALLPGCSRSPSSPVLAKVGDREITVADFEAELNYRQKVQQPLPDKQALLDQMIDREVSLQKARAAGLENDPAVRRSYEDMLAGKLKETQLFPRLNSVTVPVEEVRAVYDRELSHYAKPAKVQMALIYMKTERTTKPDQLVQIEARMKEARDQAGALPSLSKGFGQVALNFSEDQASRYRGGNVGWFDVGETNYRWPGEIISLAAALKTNGEMSGVVKAANGYYLVARLDSRPATVTPFAQVQPGLERRLLTAKKQQAETAFLQEMRRSLSIRTDAQVLNQVAYPTQIIARTADPAPPGLPRTQ